MTCYEKETELAMKAKKIDQIAFDSLVEEEFEKVNEQLYYLVIETTENLGNKVLKMDIEAQLYWLLKQGMSEEEIESEYSNLK